MTLRVCYSKEDPLRFLSHLDLINTLIRAMRRARIPFAYSQGYNPRPRLAMGPPLTVGLTGLQEYMDVQLEEELSLVEFSQALTQELPVGLSLVKVAPIEKGPSLMAYLDTACYWIPFYIQEEQNWTTSFSRFFQGGAIWTERIKKGQRKRIDLQPLLRGFKWEQDGGQLQASLYVRSGSQGNVRPQELLKILPENIYGLTAPLLTQVMRTGLYHEQGGSFIPPL